MKSPGRSSIGSPCGVRSAADMAQAEAFQDTARTLHFAGITSLVLGAGLAAGGVVWFVARRGTPRAATVSSARPLAASVNGGILLGLSGAF